MEGLSSVPEGPVSLDAKHSWACPPGSLFLIRSASYLVDKKKVRSRSTPCNWQLELQALSALVVV